jgi:FkbM family methyltransferase
MPQPVLRGARRFGSAVKRWLRPSREHAAWQHACRLAETVPRFTPGQIELDGYDIAYADLLTLCPQWHDMFVERTLNFESRSATPRILDCGANIGLASLYFKSRYPQARITAYEADPALASICRRNLASNRAGDVDVEAVAVWTRAGVVSFQQEGADSGAIAGTSAGLAGKDVPVPAIRLRDVIARERIELLKMDIEGAEAPVLADCRDALGNVQAMILEVHEFDPHRRTTPQILGLLEQAGFRVGMSDIVPLPWRDTTRAASPFPRSPAVWAVTVRAWRDDAHA